MALQIDIPESIVAGLRLPAAEMEPRLRAELAISLYAQGILSFGKASELAGISRYEFAGLIGSRDIPRHYADSELAQDVDYAGVSNTSPISNLASIGRLDLLKSQFAAVWIPDGVFGELAVHPDPSVRGTILDAIRNA
ncbi:MAG: UPF0175 family protein [Bryobacteraceae bacterium]